jgi:hypothetical protein
VRGRAAAACGVSYEEIEEDADDDASGWLPAEGGTCAADGCPGESGGAASPQNMRAAAARLAEACGVQADEAHAPAAACASEPWTDDGGAGDGGADDGGIDDEAHGQADEAWADESWTGDGGADEAHGQAAAADEAGILASEGAVSVAHDAAAAPSELPTLAAASPSELPTLAAVSPRAAADGYGSASRLEDHGTALLPADHRRPSPDASAPMADEGELAPLPPVALHEALLRVVDLCDPSLRAGDVM